MINIYHEGLCSKELKNKIGESIDTFEDLDLTFDNLGITFKLITDYLESKDIKFYYLRVWKENEHIIVDYGSHSNFIILEEVKNGVT